MPSLADRIAICFCHARRTHRSADRRQDLVFRRAVGRITSALCVSLPFDLRDLFGVVFRNPGALSSDWRAIVLIAVLPGLAAAT